VHTIRKHPYTVMNGPVKHILLLLLSCYTLCQTLIFAWPTSRKMVFIISASSDWGWFTSACIKRIDFLALLKCVKS